MLSDAIQTRALTVTEYSARLGRALREVGEAVLEGEVQKVSTTPRGMLYFDLTDGEALLSCKVFGRDAAQLERRPEPGDLVQVLVDRPDWYAGRGSLSLIVSRVSLAGEGELLRRRRALIARLTAEGLCGPDRRRPLPRFPRAVGVIAGAGSDGMSDVVRALSDRWPAVQVVTCACLVQGKAAPRQLIDALARLQEHPLVDVIVLARGGGSVQDLACFDDESLCRALFACGVPVVCAIGHTDNNPVCNHVAWPAFTPSRSAELLVPSAFDLRRELAVVAEQLRAVDGRVQLASERVVACGHRLDCGGRLETRAGMVRERADDLQGVLDRFLVGHEQGLELGRRALAAAPPRAARALAGQRAGTVAAAAALAGAGAGLTAIGAEVRAAGERVRQGTRRQLDDHARDFGRALERLAREARAGLRRRGERALELVGRQREIVRERARRRLEDAGRDVAHGGALIAARDFRRRGWLLAFGRNGAAVRSVTELEPGARIGLQLHDGHADALIAEIHLDHDLGSATK